VVGVAVGVSAGSGLEVGVVASGEGVVGVSAASGVEGADGVLVMSGVVVPSSPQATAITAIVTIAVRKLPGTTRRECTTLV
jgi:hypothetical protein